MIPKIAAPKIDFPRNRVRSSFRADRKSQQTHQLSIGSRLSIHYRNAEHKKDFITYTKNSRQVEEQRTTKPERVYCGPKIHMIVLELRATEIQSKLFHGSFSTLITNRRNIATSSTPNLDKHVLQSKQPNKDSLSPKHQSNRS